MMTKQERRGRRIFIETLMEFVKWLVYPLIFVAYLALLKIQPENKVINFLTLAVVFLAILFIINYIKEFFIWGRQKDEIMMKKLEKRK